MCLLESRAGLQDGDPLCESVGEDARQVFDVPHENIERER